MSDTQSLVVQHGTIDHEHWTKFKFTSAGNIRKVTEYVDERHWVVRRDKVRDDHLAAFGIQLTVKQFRALIDAGELWTLQSCIVINGLDPVNESGPWEFVDLMTFWIPAEVDRNREWNVKRRTADRILNQAPRVYRHENVTVYPWTKSKKLWSREPVHIKDATVIVRGTTVEVHLDENSSVTDSFGNSVEVESPLIVQRKFATLGYASPDRCADIERFQTEYPTMGDDIRELHQRWIADRDNAEPFHEWKRMQDEREAIFDSYSAERLEDFEDAALIDRVLENSTPEDFTDEDDVHQELGL